MSAFNEHKIIRQAASPLVTLSTKELACVKGVGGGARMKDVVENNTKIRIEIVQNGENRKCHSLAEALGFGY